MDRPHVALLFALLSLHLCSVGLAQEQGLDRPAVAAVQSALAGGDTEQVARLFAEGAVCRQGLETPQPKAELLGKLSEAETPDTETSFTQPRSIGTDWLVASIAGVEGDEALPKAVAICEAWNVSDWGLTHVQFSGPEEAPEAKPEEVTELLKRMAAARRAGNADDWLAPWDPEATVFLDRWGKVQPLSAYETTLRDELARTGPQSDYDLAPGEPVFRGTLCIVAAFETRLNTDPKACLFVFVHGPAGWSIVHMLAEQGRPTVPVPSIDPQAKGTPQGKPPTSKSFRRLPLPLPKSRRNRPYIQGDVLVWQDNIIRDEDYDVWGFHVPTQGLYLINAPEPVSNQTSPVINDLRGYVAWTDDGTKRSGVDLYGLHLQKATPIPWGASFAPAKHPEMILVNGVQLPRPRSDALTAEPGDQGQQRMSGWSIVYVSKPEKGYQHLRWANLRRFPLQSKQITGPQAIEPSDPDVCGRWVVWQDRRNGDWDIYALDLTSGREFPVCVAPGDQVAPRVDGKIAVWQDGRRDPRKCRGTAPPRTESPQDPFPVRLPSDEKPKPSELAYDDDAAWCVLAADLTTGQTMFVGGELGPAVEPDIDGPVIVWRERILGDWDIMMLHLALPLPLMVTCDLLPDYQPSVWGDRIAWVTREGASESINLLWWVVPADNGITAAFAGSLLGKLVALPGSDLYHRASCWHVATTRDFRLVDRDAIARGGLKPCPVCHPPEQ